MSNLLWFPPGIFKIEDSAHVARLWGLRKNRPAMNYDKLSRSIRQYYKKGIIRKPDVSQRLVYQFVHPVWEQQHSGRRKRWKPTKLKGHTISPCTWTPKMKKVTWNTCTDQPQWYTLPLPTPKLAAAAWRLICAWTERKRQNNVAVEAFSCCRMKRNHRLKNRK